MTDTEEKAIAFLKAVQEQYPDSPDDVLKHIAILRLIEQTKPKPDPLVEVLKESDIEFEPDWDFAPQAKAIRVALEARGLKIMEVKNDD